MNENELHIKGLKYQLSGHFLFNILNTIRVLIKKEPDKACDLVNLFSDYMRYALAKVEGFYSTLEEERNGLELFFKLQEVRFHLQVTMRWELLDSWNSFRIPSFILQPAAERIFKKAAGNAEGEKIILVSGELLEKTLKIYVSTPLAHPDKKSSSGFVTASDVDLGLEEASFLITSMKYGDGLIESHTSENGRMVTFTIPTDI